MHDLDPPTAVAPGKARGGGDLGKRGRDPHERLAKRFGDGVGPSGAKLGSGRPAGSRSNIGHPRDGVRVHAGVMSVGFQL